MRQFIIPQVYKLFKAYGRKDTWTAPNFYDKKNKGATDYLVGLKLARHFFKHTGNSGGDCPPPPIPYA